MQRLALRAMLGCAVVCSTACSPVVRDTVEGNISETSPVQSRVLSGGLDGIDARGQLTGQRFTARFQECDNRNTCDGEPLKYGCDSDPNSNSRILKLEHGAILFDAKMGLDADGSPYSKARHGTDQPETSLRYPLPGEPSINADRVPFIVVPLGGFESELGVTVGDVAAVIHRGKRVYALVADQGPKCKLGEGSIQLHEMLGHSVCQARSSAGDCERLRNVGIERDVTYVIFPGTRRLLYDGLTPDNIIHRIESVGAESWKRQQSSRPVDGSGLR